jgi:hypothetical protein
MRDRVALFILHHSSLILNPYLSSLILFMLPLHYKTRRFFCRVGFVLFCLTPTAGVLVWAGWLSTSAHVEACRRQIEEQFQLAAKLATVSHPRPDVDLYEGLELLDPQTRQRLIYVPRLEAATGNGQLLLIATGPEIEARGLARLQTLVAPPRRRKSSVSLVAGSLILREADGQGQFKDVGLRMAQTADGDECELHFRLAAFDAPQPIQVRLVREPDSSAISLVELDTGGAELPCTLAVPLVPWLAHLGQRATFRGTLAMMHDSQGWRGNVQGRLTEIDLARAIAANFPHRIDGLADLQLERARISQSRLAEVVGSVSAGPGLIGPSLRMAAVEALELVANPAVPPEGILDYEQLAFDFTLDARGVSLIGRCRHAAPGALVINRRQTLFAQPREQLQPVSALIRTLAPSGPGWVPATRESAWLLEILPVESSTPP